MPQGCIELRRALFFFLECVVYAHCWEDLGRLFHLRSVWPVTVSLLWDLDEHVLMNWNKVVWYASVSRRLSLLFLSLHTCNCVSICCLPTLPPLYRNSRSESRTPHGVSTWCSWAGQCWQTSWKTRTTSGWRAKSTRRRACVSWRS